MSWQGVDFSEQAKPLGQALALESRKRIIAEQRTLRMYEFFESVACVPCCQHAKGKCQDWHHFDIADWCAPCLARAALEAADDVAVTVATAK